MSIRDYFMYRAAAAAAVDIAYESFDSFSVRLVLYTGKIILEFSYSSCSWAIIHLIRMKNYDSLFVHI